MNKLMHGDCLEQMATLPDSSINLIVIDPPYNINKAAWDKIDNYIEWMGLVFAECQRVLMDNGSFYFFHNDFLQIVDLQRWINRNSDFTFKQLIVWNKKFAGAKNEGFLQGFIEPEGLRNYQLMAEYCLFYTFQDETGLSKVMLDVNNFKPLREYFKCVLDFIGIPKVNIIKEIGQCADHCFRHSSTQWDLPTRETYNKIIDIFGVASMDGYREYESLREEYESLREEYESLRYTFNNQKSHHSIWNYEIAKKQGHITPKPVPLIENIIKHSSNEGDIVLDCFMGSGTTGVACVNLKRSFIGIERDDKYFAIASDRIAQSQRDKQQELFNA